MNVKKCSLASLDGIEFQAAWIVVLRCSISSIISLRSLKDIYVLSVFFTCSRKRSQFVLLLCSMQGSILLITLLLTLIVMGEWSEDSSGLILIENYVLAILFMTPKSIISGIFDQWASMLSCFVIYMSASYKALCL